MYTLIIALLVGTAISTLYALTGLWGGWWVGGFLGLIGFFASNAIVARRLMKNVQESFVKAQKLAQGGHFDRAVATLEDLLPKAKWQILLESQVRAQIGILKFLSGDEEAALQNLSTAHARVTDAHLLRASILARRDQYAEAKSILERTIKKNKKQILPYHLLAWFHQRDKEVDAAIEVLARCEKADDDNDATKDNLARLKNEQKMNMKQFGDAWYALGFERHPAQVQGVHMGRRGFRQPSQKKKQSSGGKPKKRRR